MRLKAERWPPDGKQRETLEESHLQPRSLPSSVCITISGGMRRCFCLIPYAFRQAPDEGRVIVDFLNILVNLGPATHRISMICSAMVEYLYVED